MSETQTTSNRTYFFVYLALMILLALTVGAAYLPLGPLHSFVAVGIAILKAGLVAAFFMGLRFSSGRVRLLLAGGLLLLMILIGLSMADYLTRLNGLPFTG